MALLLDDLLDIARITQGKLRLKTRVVALLDVVTGAVESLRPAIDAKRQQLTIRLPPESVLLDADPLRLSQIVANLLTNASKYSEADTRIELSGSVDTDTLTLSVRDNGIGLRTESISTIFEMFAQVDSGNTRSDGGLGIGLALVKGLAELHGGAVEARSDGLGHGSEFIVRLPLTAAQPTASRTSNDSSQPNTRRRRILVADDNRDAADSLSMLLALEGHQVRVAYCGSDALSIAREFQPHVALLDIGMPDLDGYEVAHSLRRESWGESLQLIALTGWGQEEDRRRATQAGFDHHLVKPADSEQLLSLITRRSDL
jgi:CheY-like chemotaxis protein/two-component sensor histidine kinase